MPRARSSTIATALAAIALLGGLGAPLAPPAAAQASGANAPPVLAIEGALDGRENDLLTWRVLAADPDGDAVALVVFPLPRGAAFADHGDGTGTFSWTPDFSQSGAWVVWAQASDGTDRPQVQVNLTVADVNRAPVWKPLPEQTVAEGATLDVLVTASDPDGDALAYAAHDRPPGAWYNATSRKFSWTPAYTQSGRYEIRFVATDGDISSTLHVNVTVVETNRPPVPRALADREVLANRTLLVPLSATDPDRDAVSFSVRDAPPGVRVSGATLSWRPPPDAVGAHVLTVVATDARGGSATTPLRVAVGENLAPLARVEPPARADVLAPADFAASAEDPEAGGAVSYAWDFDDADGLDFVPAGQAPAHAFLRPGPHRVTLRATDADGMAAFATALVDVDDALRLVVEAAPQADPTAPQRVRARLTHWDGQPVAGARLAWSVTWLEAAGVAGPELHRGAATTREDGSAVFFVPLDAEVANLPGAHRVHVHARLATSYQGDPEEAAASAVYGGGLP